MFDRSTMYPMNRNSGTAINTSFDISQDLFRGLAGFGLLEDYLLQLLDVAPALRRGSTPQRNDAADRLDHALQQHEDRRERDDRLERIDWRPCWARRAVLVLQPRDVKVPVTRVQQRQHRREEEQDQACQLDAGPDLDGQHPRDEVPAHVRVLRHGI